MKAQRKEHEWQYNQAVKAMNQDDCAIAGRPGGLCKAIEMGLDATNLASATEQHIPAINELNREIGFKRREKYRLQIKIKEIDQISGYHRLESR